MTSSFFDSPHGLKNVNNISTAMDLAKLSAIAMREEPLFRKIVKTRNFVAEFESN